MEKFFNDLAERKASNETSINPVATSKILFALRPNVFAPWDNATRGPHEPYWQYLERVQAEIEDLIADARNFKIEPSSIPSEVARPRSTLPKLVDEFFFVQKNAHRATEEEVGRWYSWL